MKYIAYTPKEGQWPFTLSDSPEEAQTKLRAAILMRRVLSYPIANPISVVAVEREALSS